MSHDYGVTEGHSPYSLHRYREDVKHMVIFDDLVEHEHHRVRLYLSDAAYQLLKQEGYISTDRRGGTTVRVPSEREIPKESLEGFKLRISELRLAGMSKEEILQLCDRYYEEAK